MKISVIWVLSLSFSVFIGCVTVALSLKEVPFTANFAAWLLFFLLIYLVVKYKIPFVYLLLFLFFGIMNTEIKVFDLLFVAVALIMFVIRKLPIDTLRQTVFIHVTLFSFLLISFLSVLSSVHISTGIVYYIHTLFVVSIFYFLVLFIRSEREFKGIMWGYTISAFISTVIVLGERAGILSGFNTLFQGIRAKGFFQDPNDFSPFLVLAILFLFNIYIDAPKKHWKSYIYLAMSVAMAAALLLSMSRAAVLNLGIAFVIYSFFSIRNKKKLKKITTFITVFSAGIFIIFIQLRNSIIEFLKLRFYAGGVIQSYDLDRFLYQREGILAGSTNLLGIGPGQFELIYNYATHNLFIRVIAENGWLAFLPFSLMLLYVLVNLIIKRKSTIWGIPVYMFLSVYIGLIVNSFFLDTLHWRFLWFYLGMTTILLVNTSREKSISGVNNVISIKPF